MLGLLPVLIAHKLQPYVDCSLKMAEHGGLNYVIRGKAGLEMFASIVPLIENQIFLHSI